MGCAQRYPALRKRFQSKAPSARRQMGEVAAEALTKHDFDDPGALTAAEENGVFIDVQRS